MNKAILDLGLMVALSAAAHSATADMQTTKVKNYKPIALGHEAKSTGTSPLAIGTQAAVAGVSSAAIGSRANVAGNGSTAAGMDAQVKGNLSVAVGARAQALHNTASAFGSSAQAAGYSSSALGKGTIAKGIASVAVGNHAEAHAGGDVATGSHAKATAGSGAAYGSNSKATGNAATAIASGANASERFSSAFGYNAHAKHQHGVALGSLSETDATVGTKRAEVNGAEYTFAGGNPGGNLSVGNGKMKRTVTNVAAGRIDHTSTDAINGSQLYAVAGQVGDNAKAIAGVRAHTQHNAKQIQQNRSDIANLNSGLARLQHINGQMQQQLRNIEKENRAGVAGALATANIPQAHQAGQFAVGAGAGHFKGENAVAVGASYITSGGRLVLKGSAATHTGKSSNWGFGAGLAYTFGGRDTIQPVVAPVVVEREVIVREVEADNRKKIRQ